MKQIFYSCILATAMSVALAQALIIENPFAPELNLDIELSNESTFCQDQKCDCSKLIAESTALRTISYEFDQIPCDKIHDFAKQFVRRHLPIQPKAAHQASVKAHITAQTTVANICTMLSAQLSKNNTKTISKENLRRVLRIALSPIFTDNKIPSPDLVNSIDFYIKKMLKAHDYTVDDIPVELKKEYASERLKIIFYFKNLADQRKIVTIPDEEIHDAVEKMYKPFIELMQYRYLWHWSQAEIANLRKDDPTKIPSSYLIPNPESKKLRKHVAFLNKK